MTTVALMSRPSPSTAVRSLPSLLAPPSASSSPVITLPRLHLSAGAASPPFHTFASTQSSSVVLKPLVSISNHSPMSPVSFAERTLSPEPKFGLAHLLEAAEHCHALPALDAQTRASTTANTQPQQQHDTMAFTKNRLHSIDYLITRPTEDERPVKRARPDLQLDTNTSFPFSLHQQSHHSPQSVYQSIPYNAVTPVFQNHESSYMHMTPVGSQDEVSRQTEGPSDTRNVWETVLVTGNFPDDVCLSENPSCCSKSSESVSNPVKQGRWTNDEKEFAENLIQQVRNGEVSLPANTSLRKFIADSLQCKAMRVSKKFRSLRACPSPNGSSSGDDRKFNPLSLHSIMNEDAEGEADAFDEDMEQQQSPKSSSSSSKTLKRSDYSQHGAVRSGRWSLEEENYAKAMIEAFKNGFLPLHGNVSLRKFLSEVLVCHPMRISKKFVGYVRKYHWYRIAAGKCDPEAKRRALEQLCHFEREFWASLHQNQEWATIQQENRQ